MRTFLRFFGIVELFGVAIGIITYPIFTSDIDVLLYILFILLGLLLGALALYAASLLDKLEASEPNIKKAQRNISTSNNPVKTANTNNVYRVAKIKEDVTDSSGKLLKKGAMCYVISTGQDSVRIMMNDGKGGSYFAFVKRDMVEVVK